MIFFEHVSKFILTDVSIHIPQKAAVGLIGPSGCGKTTFLKLACGLLQPAEGCIHTMRLIPERNRRKLGTTSGALFSDIPFFREEETVESNFQNLKIIHRMKGELFTREYTTLAEKLGFDAFAKETVKQLSLGQRHRAELGALLLTRPKLLLLDDVAEGLDQTAKDHLRELLIQRQAEGATLVISSHNMEEISAVCDRIALLDQGSLRYYGDRELLLKRFAPVEVMEICFSGNLPDLEDLPLAHCSLEQNKLKLTYNSNFVTSAELLRHILAQTTVTAVTTHKSGLSDAICRNQI